MAANRYVSPAPQGRSVRLSVHASLTIDFGQHVPVEYFGSVPAPPLDAYVDDIFVLSGNLNYARLNVPPMPSAQLLINLGDPFVVRHAPTAAPSGVCVDAAFVGVPTKRAIVDFPSSVQVVGVHFKPWGLSRFVSVPAIELRDGVVRAEDLWGVEVGRLRDRVGEASSAGGMVQILEDALRERLWSSPSRGFDLVEATAGVLAEAWGAVSVGGLAHGAGVSGNHLALQFKRHVGVTPKRMARIYRFARLILSVDSGSTVDWAALAHTVGYFDQPHLSKEFKDFTGHTPSEYLAFLRRLPAGGGFPPDRGPMPAD